MSNLFLVGFMGAGKSLVGRLVAERTDRRFIDLDSHLEDRFKVPIVEVFARRGEVVFRKAEREALQWASGLDGAVVATGGGAFCDPENQNIIHGRDGRSVYLDVTWTVLAERLMADHQGRPMFSSLDRAEKLWTARKPHYEAATWTIQLSGTEAPEEVADRVVILETGALCAT